MTDSMASSYPERATLFDEAPLEPMQFLKWALPMTVELAQRHANGRVYGALTPSSFVVNPDMGPALLPPESEFRITQENIPYLAPEAITRRKLVPDHRADLYSLGVIFYQLLTGTPPFVAQDELAWFHSHLARPVMFSLETSRHLPAILRKIVLKLLSKDLNERYQSAMGLSHDLEACLEYWRRAGGDPGFPLGRQDLASAQLRIPPTLYGRQDERSRLMAVLQRVTGQGGNELLLITGQAGVGKTALIQELHEPVIQSKGFFITGKCDQLNRGMPYFPHAQAFHGLIMQILGASEERIVFWRARLCEALGTQGRLLINIIPALEIIMGQQPPVADIPPQETSDRFHAIFKKLVDVFADADHPLVFFLDDLQWADADSLKLLEYLLLQPDLHHVLFIAVCRDNEVQAGHSLHASLRTMRQAGRLHELELGPLAPPQIQNFLSDTLNAHADSVAPLAAFLHKKTDGNPFFLIQYVRNLVAERLITLDSTYHGWVWDMEAIKGKEHTDNVIDFMLTRLRKLPLATQKLLQYAACLGNKGRLQVLEQVAGSDEFSMEALKPAVRDGIVYANEESYRFLHDRMQQAAYALTPPDAQQRVHLIIARLLGRIQDDSTNDFLFDRLGHFQAAEELLADPEERMEAARLALAATLKARTSAAGKSALEYSRFGVRLLPEDAWLRDHALTFELHVAQAESAWRSGQAEAAEQEFQVLLQSPHPNDLDQVRVHRLLLEVNITQGKLLEALQQCRQGLAILDIDLPTDPSDEAVQSVYALFRRTLGDRPIEILRDLPPIQEPRENAALDIMAAALPLAIFVSLNTLSWLCCRMVSASLQHGGCDAATSGYAYSTTILGSRFGEYKEAYRIGKVAYDLAQRDGCIWKARIFVAFGNIANIWVQPMRSGIPYIRAALPAGLETGDFVGACYSCNHLISNLLAVGEPLGRVYEEAEVGLHFVRPFNYHEASILLSSQLHLILALQGRPLDFEEFGLDERTFESSLSKSQMGLLKFWHLIRRMQAAWMLGGYEEALAIGEAARPLRWSSPGHVEEAEHHFYHALTLASACRDKAHQERDKWFKELLEYCAIHQSWAGHCPENFAARARLLEAEIHSLKGEDLPAMHCYEEAIRLARSQQFVHIEGSSHELAANHYERTGFQAFAQQYRREARQCYLRWGANGKVQEMERRFPFLKATGPSPQPDDKAIDIDTLSLLRATQGISGVIVPNELSGTLMRLVVEASGAERGFLILTRQGNLVMEATAQTDASGLSVSVLNSEPVRECRELPHAILNFVQRTRQRVALDDAREPHAFIHDEYIRKGRPRSILCLPIVRKGTLVGLIYLENNLVAGTFTNDKLTALEILASQAAISIENAHLYAELRSEEEKLRATLSSMTDGLLVADMHGRITLINDVAVQTLCLNEEEAHRLQDRVQLRTTLDLETIEGESVPYEDLPLSRALQGETLKDVNYRMRHRNSAHEIFLRVSSAPLRNPAGELQGAVLVIRDVTELMELDQLKDEFLKAMAHELKTPLLVMSGYFEMFQLLKQKGASDGTLDECMRRIEKGFHRLKSLVITLVDVAVFQSRKLNLQLEEVDLKALARERLDSLADAASEHQLLFAGSASGPIPVRGDRVRLSQVLDNFLQNAIKYSPHGGSITLDIHEEADSVVARVTDQGIGIPPERQERLFERFYRAHAETEHDYGGMGVGLFLALEIVQAHHGRIWFSSQPGKGSTFCFSLPRMPQAALQ